MVKFLRKERIEEYLANIDRQLEDLNRINATELTKEFFLNKENSILIKSIKYTLACAIQDVCRISLHISVTLGLTKVRESESEAILALGDAGIISKEFAKKIKGMPSFRNKIIHDYLPNEFDAEKIYEVLQSLDDFKKFCKYIQEWIEKEEVR